MSHLLALDTSTPQGSVSLGADGSVVAERAIGTSIRHAESLLPAIAELLEEERLTPADLAAIVVGAGPGSFTGVRIAAATARGLVRALGIPLFAYSSLLALAEATGRTDRAVCALFDARRGEVYAGCYRFEEQGWNVLREPTAAPIDEIMTSVARYAPVFVAEATFSLTGAGERVMPVRTSAAALIRLAAIDPEAGRIVQPAHWEPHYLRPPGAERTPW